ncbi:hypothetical protein JKP88DRAFT_296251 [Tribonema minus]|uniref:Uncharacterized protein n=1 Tax=Tribonema minus TaxID=303371 RepID=A0A835ZIK3_9STRA|nr:hypothetical protein JKP88DRAFT_296251 [Tribonema minus]
MSAPDVINISDSDDEAIGGGGADVSKMEDEQEQADQPPGDYFFNPDGGHGVSAYDLKHSIGPAWACYERNLTNATSLGMDYDTFTLIDIYSLDDVAPARQLLSGKMPNKSWYRLPPYEERTQTAAGYHALMSAFKSKVLAKLGFKVLSHKYRGVGGHRAPTAERKKKLLAQYRQRKNVFDDEMLKYHKKLAGCGYRVGGYSESDDAKIVRVTDNLRHVFIAACADRGLMGRERSRLFIDLKEMSLRPQDVRVSLQRESSTPAEYGDKRQSLEKFLQQFIDAHHSIFSLHTTFEEDIAKLKQSIRHGLLQDNEPGTCLTWEQEEALNEVLADVLTGKRR